MEQASACTAVEVLLPLPGVRPGKGKRACAGTWSRTAVFARVGFRTIAVRRRFCSLVAGRVDTDVTKEGGQGMIERLLRRLRSGIERRRTPRRAVIETGWIRSEHDKFPYVCVIWDLSMTGARLALSHSAALPNKVVLALDRDDLQGTLCEVVWRSEGQVGVRFLSNTDRLTKLLSKDTLVFGKASPA